MTCKQTGCEQPALFRYTWPGKDESHCCVIHAVHLKSVAKAIGLHLQLIPLTVEEQMSVPNDGQWDDINPPDVQSPVANEAIQG